MATTRQDIDILERNYYKENVAWLKAASAYAMKAVMHEKACKDDVEELTRLAVARKSALEDWQRAITGMAEVAMSELG
ncbi:hypothetical protein [uncultured Fibrobacter sp.]|uniref:hypothetical protein n=1 Tax=uncultured Fibrobacter sp. TaxID=261512 RepID=UPI0025F95E7C|nr:hypothetical protein [uncultured Fibrobacter sp.]